MTSPGRAALALMAWCGFCWAPPGIACTGHGQHLARYLRAYRRGLINREAMTAVCRTLPMASVGQLVTDIDAPEAGGVTMTVDTTE